LVRYRRVGPPGAPKLRAERVVPKGICWRQDLNTLPKGGIANGMSGDEIEHLLATKVDREIPSIVARVGERSGPLESAIGDPVKWLMQTFVARAPSTLTGMESAAADFTAQNEAFIQRLLDRAVTPKMKAELNQHLDPRMPAVRARATLAAIVEAQFVPVPGWYEGTTVHVLHAHAASVRTMLSTLGLSDFPTSEQPVIEWGDNSAGLVATLSLSPNLLALMIRDGGESGWEMALRHTLLSLRHRQSAICRQEASDGPWLVQAQQFLIPWKVE
jgi:hypothetical protein